MAIAQKNEKLKLKSKLARLGRSGVLMGFNEKVHAFIAARFYMRLDEMFGERGRAAFSHAVRVYAEGRGRRMAARAIRDGCPLNYATYMRYGEWVNTEEVKSLGQANETKIESLAPDCVLRIMRCPWHEQFKEMGLAEAGHAYCLDLDSSIARGFNPAIVYEVHQTLHRSDCCIHVIKGANLREGDDYSKSEEYLRPFSYHCAHIFRAFSDTAESIFAADGVRISADVLDDFRAEYGEKMADELAMLRRGNFDTDL